MSESIGVSAEQSGQSLPPAEPGVRPRWVAFGVIVGTILVLVGTPAVVGAVVPPKAEGTVGVYERIVLHSEPEEEGVAAGFIAPQGWLLIDAADGEAEGTVQRLETRDGEVSVTASVHSPVASPHRLLREEVPIGAILTPIHRLDSAPLLTADLLEYDLGAGQGVHQRIAVCEVLRNTSCLLFEVTVPATHASSDAGPLLPDLTAMVASAEVQP